MKVSILEIRQPMNDPAVNSRHHADVMLVASDRQKALDAMRADPGMGGDDETWCFSVYDVEVDDPKCREQDMRFYAFDGRECQSPDEAFEALLSARAAARP
jgi:hypothetical protein